MSDDRMPGDPAALETRLRRDVGHLAGTIGARSVFRPEGLASAADWIESRFRETGFDPARQTFRVEGVDCSNLEVEIRGSSAPEEILVVGAHYDGVGDCPAANDNATGTAAVLALAASMRDAAPRLTLRFAAFVNEEPPWFRGEAMGSRVYARRCRERGERVAGMISLETLGCYSDAPGSQRYPPGIGWLYPATGNFAAFVGNLRSWRFVRRCAKAFRASSGFPLESAALPGWLPGVGWSDHESFWIQGYPALMVTDTAPFRYPHYHTAEDTPDKIDHPRFAAVVRGLEGMLRRLSDAPGS
jgi:Zn-dependent M28 family amino/carboxypeptidase